IRMMKTGDLPRKAEPDVKREPVLIGDIVTEVWNNDEPFLDPDEMQDPRVRMWREILRQRYNFNKTHKPK
ncbi:MAG: hypothetical protein IIY92_01875, partial [Lachnospiraceae bacterium]|nr:hypothetical protein [Lachnospiraceae bacterium]